MKKIKKFKIELKKREVMNNFKIASEIKEVSLQMEEVIIAEMERSREWAATEAIFETYTAEDFEGNFGINVREEKAVAASAVIMTIGPNIEKALSEAKEKGEHIRSQVIHAAGIEACNAGIRFIFALLKDEAQRESCELLDPQAVLDKEQSARIVNYMAPGKSNVSIDAQGNISPVYSAVSIIKWKPKKKSSKS